MRRRAARILVGVSGLSMLACSPMTDGYGQDAIGEDATGNDDLGGDSWGASNDEDTGPGSNDESGSDSADSGDTGEETGGETGEAYSCEDPRAGGTVTISLLGAGLQPDDCTEASFSARVDVAAVGIYGLLACSCDDPVCDGEMLELEISVPDPDWLPDLVPGSCHQFHVFAEETKPGVCRRNRIDISPNKLAPPWYSTGSAYEDLDHNGLALTPVEGDACDDICGEWELRDMTVTTANVEQTLGWGQTAPVGSYEVINWRSYVTPNGCGVPSVDVTAWTAR